MCKAMSYPASLLLSLALLVMPATVAAQPTPTPGSGPRILPPDARHYGKTYGEWSAVWWQWFVAQPPEEVVACGPGPVAGVWFGGGPSSDVPITLACTMPADTALFFPVIAAECSEAEGDGTTEAELRACATELADAVTVAEATIDGVAVRDMARYRVQSPLFTFTLPEDNLFNARPGPSPSVADGYWIMLAPLSVGAHTVYIHGAAGPPGEDPVFEVTVTVNITVTASPAMPGLPNTGEGGAVVARGVGSGVTSLLLAGLLAVLVGWGVRRHRSAG